MDLQISFFLLFTLFAAGHSLSCYECTGSCTDLSLETCPSGSKCMSITTVTQVGNNRNETKIKQCADNCRSGSMNLGTSMQSAVCCNTDGCNSQDALGPSNVPNGKTCYSCDEKSCLNILSCSGTEDRCVNVTGIVRGQSMFLKGCISKSACNAPISYGNIEFSCCEGNLCNGAESVTQSFLFLCCSLLSFILLH